MKGCPPPKGRDEPGTIVSGGLHARLTKPGVLPLKRGNAVETRDRV